MFTLQRSKFREMLALSVSASLVQRVAWMQDIPELVRYLREKTNQVDHARLHGAVAGSYLADLESVLDSVSRYAR